MRRLARADHSFKPLLQREIFRDQLYICRLVPIAVQVAALKIKTRATEGDTILVRHWHHKNAVARQKLLRVDIAPKQSSDESFHDPVAAGFPRVRPRPQKDAIRSL